MAKKDLKWFVVEKAGRIVDCIQAKDLCLAFQEAMDKWERFCSKGTMIEVKKLGAAPARTVPVIVRPTPEEVRNYGVSESSRTQWVEEFFTPVNFTGTRN